MLTRKTQYGWMALGGLICLFGLVLACKLRDGNKAAAQADKPAEWPIKLEPPSVESSRPANYSIEASPSLEMKKTPTAKAEDSKANSAKPAVGSEAKKRTPEPAPLLSGPPLLGTSPSSKPSSPVTPPSVMPLEGPPRKMPSPPPSTSGPILPTSFIANPPASPKDAKPEIPPSTMKEAPTKQPVTASGAPMPPPLPSPVPPATPPASSKTSATTLIAPPVEAKVAPTLFAPVSPAAPSPEHEAKPLPGEPPLAPAPGPVQIYHAHGSETLQDIARRTLGSAERWTDLHKLNPNLKTDAPLGSGTLVRLPGDACVQTDDAEPVKPLPVLRPKPAPPKTKVLPLTGTFQCSLDEKGRLTLPRAIRDQLAGSETVLVSPGPDRCLWLTNQPHLERLAERLEQSRANEADIRVFKRLYFAQTEKLTVNSEGRVSIPERLSQFAGLHQELVLVGIDDHFEVWDAARWRQYTQQKSAAASRASVTTEPE